MNVADSQLCHFLLEEIDISTGTIWQVETNIVEELVHLLLTLILLNHSDICLEAVSLDLNFLNMKNAKINEFLDSVLNLLEQARLKELQDTFRVKSFEEPLNLLIQVVFIVDALSVLGNCKVSYSDPVGLNEGKQDVVEEGLTHLVAVNILVNLDKLTLCNKELSSIHKVNNLGEVLKVLHGVSLNELFF